MTLNREQWISLSLSLSLSLIYGFISLLFKTRHICVWIRNVCVKLTFAYGFILQLYLLISICVCIEMYWWEESNLYKNDKIHLLILLCAFIINETVLTHKKTPQKTGAFSLIWEEVSNCADLFPNKRKCPFPPQPLWLTVWPVFVVEVHMYSLVLTHGLSSIHIFLTYLRKCLKLACMIIGLHKQQNTSSLTGEHSLTFNYQC